MHSWKYSAGKKEPVTDFSMFFDEYACVLIYVQVRVPIYQL
jgi:hypothetical protein